MGATSIPPFRLPFHQYVSSVLAQLYHHRWSMIEVDVQRVRAVPHSGRKPQPAARDVAIGEGMMYGDHAGIEPVRPSEEVEADDALGGDQAPLEVQGAGDATDGEA